MNSLNEASKETELMIEDLNFRKNDVSLTTKESSEIRNHPPFSEKEEMETMPSVREEFQSKVLIKPTFEANFLEKKPRPDLENRPETIDFLKPNGPNQRQMIPSKPEKRQTSVVFVKPKVSLEEVPNPLQRLKMKERRLSRISSRDSSEERAKTTQDLGLTIKDLSVPYPLHGAHEKGPLSENTYYLNVMPVSKVPSKMSKVHPHKGSENEDYIEKFLNHKNPLRKTPNESYEEQEFIRRSSLLSMKNYFRNMKNLRFIDVDTESLASEEFLNTRMRLEGVREAQTEKSLQETSDLLCRDRENAYDMNNFIKDMMDIYREAPAIEEQSGHPEGKSREFFDFDKENLNMRLKCLSPVYREMKISARGLEPQSQRLGQPARAREFGHRKSSCIQPNLYQKNRDFSEFGQHFAKPIDESLNGTGLREKAFNIRKNGY